MLSILYEDNYLITVNKPHGLQVEKSRNYPSLEAQVSEYLKTKFPWKKQWSAGVVHRLDRPACGVVIFAKTRMSLKSLNLQFEQRTVRKIYHAWVENRPPEAHGDLFHMLIKDVEKRNARVAKDDNTRARAAHLRYRLVAIRHNYSLLEVELLTGRYHQIRAQMAAIGCPIVGDVKYGAVRALPESMIFLQARKLEIRHPKTGENLIVQIPDNEKWNNYLPV